MAWGSAACSAHSRTMRSRSHSSTSASGDGAGDDMGTVYEGSVRTFCAELVDSMREAGAGSRKRASELPALFAVALSDSDPRKVPTATAAAAAARHVTARQIRASWGAGD